MGSCVGNAIANAYELQVKKLYPDKFVELSRLFVYYNARSFLGEIRRDTGTTVRAGLKAIKTYGICAESLWPYNIKMFDDRPSAAAYADAEPRKINAYYRLRSVNDIMDSLANYKPVVIAMTAFSDFMNLTGENSTVPMPSKSSIEYGGHAVCLVGYDLSRSAFLAKNSFGVDWGDNGYCWIPFEYFKDYVFEQWTFDIPEQP